jgi:hypothetical protein
MVNWAAHVEASATGTLNALVVLGSAGTTAAGGAVVRLETGPFPRDVWNGTGPPGSAAEHFAVAFSGCGRTWQRD